VHDRLSVAFVTGEHDVNRKENEASLAPMFADLGIHSKLWVVPRMGHDLPPADVHSEVYAWLADDLKRRREDAKAHPGLAVAADEAPTPDTVASRWVEEAEAELKKAGHVWRGVALLRSVVERWPNTDAGDKGRRLLRDVVNDDAKARAIVEEGGKDERDFLTAQAKALERLDDVRGALQAWRLLAKGHPETPEGKKAAEEAKRLSEALAATPYLGIVFDRDSLLVTEVVRRGPADKAGLVARDIVLTLGGVKVTTQQELRQALGKHKPGDKLDIEVKRAGKVTTLSAEVGSPPIEE